MPCKYLPTFFFPLALLVLVHVSSAASQPSLQSTHPFTELYGDRIEFTVLRHGKSVGVYTTLFESTPYGWQAQISMTLQLSWLALFKYNYHYQATETWENQQLQTLAVRIDANGDQQQYRWQKQGDYLQSTDPEQQRGAIALPVLTSHHFNADILTATRVLNTLTGQENQIAMLFVNDVILTINDRYTEAKHYQYTGELHDTDIWFSPQGHWLKLRFPDKTGALIELECKRCGV